MQHLTNQGYSWTLIIWTFQLYTLVLLVPFFMNIYPLSPKSDQHHAYDLLSGNQNFKQGAQTGA